MPGDFIQNPRSKMFVRLETNGGIQITVRSTVETVKCFLQNGSKFILTERKNSLVFKGNWEEQMTTLT